MKRFVAALLALALCAGASEAKVLVIARNAATIDQGLGLNTEQQSYQAMASRQLGAVRAVLDQIGTEYKVITPTIARTEFCRTGDFVWGYGTTAARVEHFDAVIHLNQGGLPGVTGYRPDSLATSAKAALIPQLIVFAGGLQNTTSYYTNGLIGPPANGNEGSAYPMLLSSADRSMRWFSSANIQRFYPVSMSQGMRPLIRVGTSSLFNPLPISHSVTTWSSGRDCAWCDSLVLGSAADTLTSWEIPNTGSSGASSVIVANFDGASACQDSTGTVVIPCEGDMTVMLHSLARLDSLSGGLVFDKNKLPIRASIIIGGGFNRSGRRNPGGISPSDTASLKGSLDSLAALVPSPRLAVTVDVDSIANYTSEKTWWDKLPNVRFIPTTRAGMDSAIAWGCRPGASCEGGVPALSSGYNGQWRWTNLRDVFGRYRARVFVGPDSVFRSDGSGGYSENRIDSTIVAGVRSLFFHADSVFGRNRVSRVLVAPFDDWSPKNMGWTSRARDSLIYALSLAGAVAVVSDAQIPEADPNRAPVKDLVRGWINRQGRYRSAFGGEINVLTHSGYPILGGTTLVQVRAGADGAVDSVPPYVFTTGVSNGTIIPNVNYEMGRFWNQLFRNDYRDVDYWPNDVQHDAYDDVVTPRADRFNNIKRGNVYKLSANDFGGDPANPARPGYWIVKSIWSAMREINTRAGRTVIMLDYPENIKP